MIDSTNMRTWWQLSILIGISTLIAVISLNTKHVLTDKVPEAITFASALNKKPSGVSGFYELTKNVGLTAALWQKPYRYLPRYKGILIIVEPLQSLEKYEINDILAWVAEGNQLVYLDNFDSNFEREILKRLGLGFATNKTWQEQTISPVADTPASQFVQAVMVEGGSRLAGGDRLQPIVKDDQGVILGEITYGKGQILLGTCPNLIANRRLGNAISRENFQLLANWLMLNGNANGNQLWFDEKCHGLTNANNLFVVVLRSTAAFFFAQLIIILAVAIVSQAQRFGKIHEQVKQRPISNLDFVFALANTYQRAKAKLLAAETLSRHLRHNLAKASRLSAHDDDETLANAYTRQFNQAEDVDVLLSILSYSSAKNKSKAKPIIDLKYFATNCDRIQNTLNQKASPYERTYS